MSLRSKSWTESETTLLGTPVSTATPETPAQKVELFLKLFRCRESVFPKLWENKTKEKKGYSPACTNEWVRGVCGKPPQGADYDRNLRHSGKRLTLSFTGTLTPTAERFPLVIESAKAEELGLGALRTFRLEGGMSAKERRTVLTEIGLAEGKEDVMIYDYLDSYCAVFIKMYRERIKAYRKMGYKIVEPDHFFGGKSMRQDHLFL